MCDSSESSIPVRIWDAREELYRDKREQNSDDESQCNYRDSSNDDCSLLRKDLEGELKYLAQEGGTDRSFGPITFAEHCFYEAQEAYISHEAQEAYGGAGSSSEDDEEEPEEGVEYGGDMSSTVAVDESNVVEEWEKELEKVIHPATVADGKPGRVDAKQKTRKSQSGTGRAAAKTENGIRPLYRSKAANARANAGGKNTSLVSHEIFNRKMASKDAMREREADMRDDDDTRRFLAAEKRKRLQARAVAEAEAAKKVVAKLFASNQSIRLIDSKQRDIVATISWTSTSQKREKEVNPWW